MTSPALQAPPNLREEMHGGFSRVEWEHLREEARYNLYFLVNGVMGYGDVTERTHGPMMRFAESDPHNRQLFLAPRGHLKTSCITEGCAVQMPLRNPDETTIAIINEEEDKAITILQNVTKQFQYNEVLQWLFPELIHERFAGPGIVWSTEKASLPRKTHHRDPTWRPLGLKTSADGVHVREILADDLIGFAAKNSPAEMQRAIKYARGMQSLLIAPAHDRIRWIGTRKLIHDLYADLMEYYGDRLGVYVMEPIDSATGEPTWPERFTLEYFQHMMETDPEYWFAEMANNPVSAGKREFDVRKLNYFSFTADGRVVGNRDGIEVRYELEDLDRVMTVDPAGEEAKNDFGAINVSGTSSQDDEFVLHNRTYRLDPSSFIEEVVNVFERFRPRVVGVERTGLSTVGHYLEKRRREKGLFMRIVPLNPRNRVKEQRIRDAIEPVLARRRLYVLTSQQHLVNQLTFFPDVKNDDDLDVLAYVADLARKPMDSATRRVQRRAAQKLLTLRDPLTGY